MYEDKSISLYSLLFYREVNKKLRDENDSLRVVIETKNTAITTYAEVTNTIQFSKKFFFLIIIAS
jgi:hypothetical protein